MRVAGRLAAEVLDMIGEHVKPGVTTDELDRLCHDYIVNVQHAIPANAELPRLSRRPICTSVNHVVCHGIPSDSVLKAGDIVNIDVTVIKDGFHGDTSRMYLRRQARRCRRSASPRSASKRCGAASEQVQPGARLGDIGHAIQSFVEEQRLLGRARVLRPRHRPDLPRGPAGAALRRARHGPRAARPA